MVDYRGFRPGRIREPQYRHLLLIIGWIVYFLFFFLVIFYLLMLINYRRQAIPIINCFLSFVPSFSDFIIFANGKFLLGFPFF